MKTNDLVIFCIASISATFISILAWFAYLFNGHSIGNSSFVGIVIWIFVFVGTFFSLKYPPKHYGEMWFGP